MRDHFTYIEPGKGGWEGYPETTPRVVLYFEDYASVRIQLERIDTAQSEPVLNG